MIGPLKVIVLGLCKFGSGRRIIGRLVGIIFKRGSGCGSGCFPGCLGCILGVDIGKAPRNVASRVDA